MLLPLGNRELVHPMPSPLQQSWIKIGLRWPDFSLLFYQRRFTLSPVKYAIDGLIFWSPSWTNKRFWQFYALISTSSSSIILLDGFRLLLMLRHGLIFLNSECRYGHALFSDSREELVQASASILTVLLNYTFGLKDFRDFAVIENDPRSPLSQQTSPIDDSRSAIEEAIASQRRRDVLEHSEHINQFRYYLSRLHRTVDFECLMNGFFTLLQNPMEVSFSSNLFRSKNFRPRWLTYLDPQKQ